MICQPCRDAADARAPRDAHCHDPACMCGHRTDRYRPATGHDAVGAFRDGLQRITDQTTEIQSRTTARPIGDTRMTFPHYWTDDTAATPEARCTATNADSIGDTVHHCAGPADHYDSSRRPKFDFNDLVTDSRGWHFTGGPHRFVWSDQADGAAPHITTPEA